MARIRSIKPEFWTSEQVMECSTTTRLMFIGMWNFADDLGRLPLAPKTIKAQIFPSDDMTSANILGMVEELSSHGLVLVYEVDGRRYLQITGWQHQRIDKPQPGRCPSPTNGYSKNVRGMVATEGIGEEGKGRDNSEANASGASAPPDPSIAEREFFQRGREILGKSAGGQLAKLKTAKGGNIALARAALETASTRDSPAEYIAGVIRAGPSSTAKPATFAQQKQMETRNVLAALGGSNSERETGRQAVDRVLSVDRGQQSGDLRSGSGGDVRSLPRASGSAGD